MANTVTADLLSASSLIVTCIGLLYTAWYSEFSTSLKLEDILTNAEKEGRRNLLGRLLWSRAIPLATASILLTAALFAPAWTVYSGASFDRDYDPVAACFAVVSFLILVITASTIWLSVRIVKAWFSLG